MNLFFIFSLLMNIFSSYSVKINSNPTQIKRKHYIENCDVTMTLMMSCRRRRFENAKIGQGNVFPTLVNTKLGNRLS